MYRINPDGITWRVKQALARAMERAAVDEGRLLQAVTTTPAPAAEPVCTVAGFELDPLSGPVSEMAGSAYSLCSSHR
jgi:hypothetical protein